MDKKFCESCGTQMQIDAKFCESCGAKQSFFDEAIVQEPLTPNTVVKAKPSFKKWIPIVAGMLVVVIVVGIFAILKPFDTDKGKSAKKSSGSANSSKSQEDLSNVLANSFSDGSLSFELELEATVKGESIEVVADGKVIGAEDIEDVKAWLELDLEGNIEGEKMDMGMDIALADETMYMYAAGMATVQSLDMGMSQNSQFEFTWESFYDILEQSGALEDFEKDMNKKEFEKACEGALKTLGEKIKTTQNGNKVTYTFDQELVKLLEEVFVEFEDAFKDKEEYEDAMAELEDLPKINVFFELVADGDKLSSIKFNVESDELELGLELKFFDYGKTEIDQDELDEFIEKCEEKAQDYENMMGGYADYRESPGVSVKL